jgi:hypothetical protein
MDFEDARVKELTEGVLYDLLPALLHAALGGDAGGGEAEAGDDPEAGLQQQVGARGVGGGPCPLEGLEGWP